MIFFCIYFFIALQLAELWPKRLMDNHGIKRAICRAKERRRASNGDLGKEMVSTKLLVCLFVSMISVISLSVVTHSSAPFFN